MLLSVQVYGFQKIWSILWHHSTANLFMCLSYYAPPIPTSEPNDSSNIFGMQNMAVDATPISYILISWLHGTESFLVSW